MPRTKTVSYRSLGIDIDELEPIEQAVVTRGYEDDKGRWVIPPVGTGGAKVQGVQFYRGGIREAFKDMPDKQQAAMIGPKRLELLKSGKIGLDDLVDKRTGRLVLLDDLRAGKVPTYPVKVPPVPVAPAVPVVPDAPKYTPLKTVKEAEAWLMDNLGGSDDYAARVLRFKKTQKEIELLTSTSRGQAVIGIKSKGMDLAKVNELNGLIAESNAVADKLKIPRLRGIVIGERNACGDGIMKFGSAKNLTQSPMVDRSSTWTWGGKAEDRPFNAFEFVADGGRSDQGARSSFWHEFGHHVHQQYQVKDVATYRNPPLERKMGAMVPSKAARSASSATKYGATDPQEWFAENFSLYQMGRKDLVSKEALELIEEMLK